MAKYSIQTYLDNGVVFQYDLAEGDTAAKAREHAAAIVANGYRHNDGNGDFEHYPPHRILKVKIAGKAVSTSYPDTASEHNEL